MADTTILLISDNEILIDQVKGVTDSVADLDFVALRRTDAAYDYDSWERVSLVLIHQADQGSAMQVSRLLRMIAAARRPVATIVLADPYDADQAITLLRMGVADYLGMPLDV